MLFVACFIYLCKVSNKSLKPNKHL
nr:unnamed protein product [Callosobruchus analis]